MMSLGLPRVTLLFSAIAFALPQASVAAKPEDPRALSKWSNAWSKSTAPPSASSIPSASPAPSASTTIFDSGYGGGSEFPEYGGNTQNAAAQSSPGSTTLSPATWRASTPSPQSSSQSASAGGEELHGVLEAGHGYQHSSTQASSYQAPAANSGYQTTSTTYSQTSSTTATTTTTSTSPPTTTTTPSSAQATSYQASEAGHGYQPSSTQASSYQAPAANYGYQTTSKPASPYQMSGAENGYQPTSTSASSYQASDAERGHHAKPTMSPSVDTNAIYNPGSTAHKPFHGKKIVGTLTAATTTPEPFNPKKIVGPIIGGIAGAAAVAGVVAVSVMNHQTNASTTMNAMLHPVLQPVIGTTPLPIGAGGAPYTTNAMSPSGQAPTVTLYPPMGAAMASTTAIPVTASSQVPQVYTVKGRLMLQVPDAQAFLHDMIAQRAVAAGIADAAGVPKGYVVVTAAKRQPRRLRAGQKHLNVAQVSYKIILPSADKKYTAIGVEKALGSKTAVALTNALRLRLIPAKNRIYAAQTEILRNQVGNQPAVTLRTTTQPASTPASQQATLPPIVFKGAATTTTDLITASSASSSHISSSITVSSTSTVSTTTTVTTSSLTTSMSTSSKEITVQAAGSSSSSGGLSGSNNFWMGLGGVCIAWAVFACCIVVVLCLRKKKNQKKKPSKSTYAGGDYSPMDSEVTSDLEYDSTDFESKAQTHFPPDMESQYLPESQYMPVQPETMESQYLPVPRDTTHQATGHQHAPQAAGQYAPQAAGYQHAPQPAGPPVPAQAGMPQFSAPPAPAGLAPQYPQPAAPRPQMTPYANTAQPMMTPANGLLGMNLGPSIF